MSSDKVNYRYYFDFSEIPNQAELIMYFNSKESGIKESGFDKYMGSKQKVEFNPSRNNRHYYEIFSNSEMGNISKILDKENKFIPQEVSCINPNCYSFVEGILKSNMGKKSRLKRGLIDIIKNRARIEIKSD